MPEKNNSLWVGQPYCFACVAEHSVCPAGATLKAGPDRLRPILRVAGRSEMGDELQSARHRSKALGYLVWPGKAGPASGAATLVVMHVVARVRDLGASARTQRQRGTTICGGWTERSIEFGKHRRSADHLKVQRVWGRGRKEGGGLLDRALSPRELSLRS